jgi:hypothetical protein
MDKLKVNWLKTRLENAMKEQKEWREIEIECRDELRQIGKNDKRRRAK